MAHTTTTGRRRGAVVLVAGAALVTLMPVPALAQRVQSNVVLVRANDVITEDLYAAGNTIIVSGVIQGDLVAVAFDSIRIDGVVEGDVIAVSNEVEITGRVDGAVRIGARALVVEGDIGDDLVAGALTVQTAASSSIGRDVLVWSRIAELVGNVGRNIEGQQRRTALGGEVAGDVDVTTRALTLLAGLRVGGDVRYTSAQPATVAQTAVIDGTFVQAEAMPPNVRVRGVRLLVQFVGVLAALGIGLGILWAAPGRSIAAGTALVRRPLAALSWGIGVASVPVALVIVTLGIVAVSSLSSSGPVVLVLLPVAVALIAVVALGLLTAPVPLALALGSRIRSEWSSYARYVAGFAVIVIVWLLPWVGGFVVAIGMLAGLGAWLVAEDPD